MKANPRYAHFQRVIEAHRGDWLQPWAGDSWRFQDIDFPSGPEILNGEGARINGGRWNVRGSFPAVYGSIQEETALQESGAHAKRYGLVIRKPRLFVAIHLDLRHVLDLRRANVRRALGVTLNQLRSEDWAKLQDAGTESLSQALGRAAHDLGVEAIIVPSFAEAGGSNVVYFPRKRDAASAVTIWDDAKLPGKKAP